jgi:hypothetical protein
MIADVSIDLGGLLITILVICAIIWFIRRI